MQQTRAESAFFLIASVMAVMGRPQRQRLALGLVEAVDCEVLVEGDLLNVARQCSQHGDADICRGEFKTSYDCLIYFLIGFDLSDLCEYVVKFGSASIDLAMMLRDEMRAQHPLTDITDFKARARLRNLVQRIAYYEDEEDADGGARAEVNLSQQGIEAVYIIGFDLSGIAQRDPEASVSQLRDPTAVTT